MKKIFEIIVPYFTINLQESSKNCLYLRLQFIQKTQVVNE